MQLSADLGRSNTSAGNEVTPMVHIPPIASVLGVSELAKMLILLKIMQGDGKHDNRLLLFQTASASHHSARPYTTQDVPCVKGRRGIHKHGFSCLALSSQ